MMIVTLQTAGTLAPTLSVHGGIIKIDLGALLLEMDADSFVDLIACITTQAVELGVYDHPTRKHPKKLFIEGDPYRG